MRLCCDETPRMQALARTRPGLPASAGPLSLRAALDRDTDRIDYAWAAPTGSRSSWPSCARGPGVAPLQVPLVLDRGSCDDVADRQATPGRDVQDHNRRATPPQGKVKADAFPNPLARIPRTYKTVP